MPSLRTFVRGSALLAAVAFSGVAAAQAPTTGTELGIGTRLGIRFVVVVLVNLLLGGALLAIGPRYAEERVADIDDDTGLAFLWGLLVGVGVPIVLGILAITIIGLIVTIPGLIALGVLGLVGNAVTIVWIGDMLSGGAGTLDAKTVGYGALALAVPSAIPVLGDLLTTLIAFFGLGAVSHSLYESRWGESG